MIYANPDMFSEVKQAWAVWVLAQQSFSAKLDGCSWGHDIAKPTASRKISNIREGFTIDYARRRQEVQIDCTVSLWIIRS